jgi:hypothetical protein
MLGYGCWVCCENVLHVQKKKNEYVMGMVGAVRFGAVLDDVLMMLP